MRDARPFLLLTRPQDGSERFATQVKARFGDTIETVIAPLQSIEWLGADGISDDTEALIFTSQNGVLGWNRALFQGDCVAYCVGPQTAALAGEFGLETVECGGNASALIALVLKARPSGKIVHFRGVHGRGDIAKKLRQQGLNCEERVVYRQAAVAPRPAFGEALRSGRPVLAPLFSPRSAALFCENCPQDATPWLAVISPNAAERVDLMLQRRMMVAEAPNGGAMLDLVEEFLNANGSGCDDDVS